MIIQPYTRVSNEIQFNLFFQLYINLMRSQVLVPRCYILMNPFLYNIQIIKVEMSNIAYFL